MIGYTHGFQNKRWKAPCELDILTQGQPKDSGYHWQRAEAELGSIFPSYLPDALREVYYCKGSFSASLSVG
jgi:hypothetical protein